MRSNGKSRLSGLCSAIGAILRLAQLGAVSPTFGTNKEFAAIAAAVLTDSLRNGLLARLSRRKIREEEA